MEVVPTYHKGFHYDDEYKKMIYKSFGKTKLCTSLLGFGGSPLALCYGDTEKEKEGIETVIESVKKGINYIDTAPFYGHGKAEIVLGKALKFIPRNAYYLATKVGRYGPDISDMFDFTAARTFQSIEESIRRLGVDYIDILQVHDLEFAPSVDIILNETLPALEKIKNTGKAKYIGITGYPISALKEILEKSKVQIDVVLSYCRYTLFDNSLDDYIPYFKKRNIAIINAAALGMGLLTNNGPPSWHPANSELKSACREAAQYCKERKVNISKLAACHSLSHPDIDVHLIGMENKAALKANLKSVWNGLTDHEQAVKQEILTKYFNNLKRKHWESKEVEKYWKTMKNTS